MEEVEVTSYVKLWGAAEAEVVVVVEQAWVVAEAGEVAAAGEEEEAEGQHRQTPKYHK